MPHQTSPSREFAVHPNRGLARALALLWVSFFGGLALAGVPPDFFDAKIPVAHTNLPPEGIYPRGQKLAFMGYSGNPARDLTNGFTVAGPVYADQTRYLDECFAHGWPVIAHIGADIKFVGKKPSDATLDESTLRDQIARQVRTLAGHKEIVWWAVLPEELRPWRPEEMKYLAVICEAIRETDPQHRPLYHYNPNHRNADTLLPIATQVDVLAKGCYVNHVGRKQDRAWVRWSMEQETQAITRAGASNAIPLLMPELCKDPSPAEDAMIRDWVRHDVYLGLCSGARGVLIWSLYPRKDVRRTWRSWYDAYAECGRELNGERRLARVFLFGEPRSDLKVTLAKGTKTTQLILGGDAEPATTSDAERARRDIHLPSWTSVEYVCDRSHWLFVVNSANTPATFSVAGIPGGLSAQNAFKGSLLCVTDGAPMRLEIPACGVVGIELTASRN